MLDPSSSESELDNGVPMPSAVNERFGDLLVFFKISRPRSPSGSLKIPGLDKPDNNERRSISQDPRNGYVSKLKY